MLFFPFQKRMFPKWQLPNFFHLIASLVLVVSYLIQQNDAQYYRSFGFDNGNQREVE